MPTATKPIKPMPPPDVVLIDPNTGQATRELYDLLRLMRDMLADLRLEIP